MFDLPLNNIAEITLIGTGGGYGESIVIHLGDNNWAVIDSCIDPNTKKSLPLQYLEEMNVDLNRVKFILCTHWHKDHIQGISHLLEKCPNADFSFACTTDRRKFLVFVSLDDQKDKSTSSTEEFLKCLTIIRNRGKEPVIVQQDRLLESINLGLVKSEIFSLSPSDYTMVQFYNEISTLIAEFQNSNKKIVINTPNAKSIALLLKLGNNRAILGSDLEIGDNDYEGWANIIKNSKAIDRNNKATYFKIPHHGSDTGYHESIWEELLGEDISSTLTPWNRNKKLPQMEMLKLYCEKCDSVFMTTPVTGSDKPKKREQNITKTIESFNKTVREVKFNLGIIRARTNILASYPVWSIELFKNAVHANKHFFK